VLTIPVRAFSRLVEVNRKLFQGRLSNLQT
jgi:hypothetical protein